MKTLSKPKISNCDKIRTFPDTDALIITNPKRAVYLNYAGCTPFILYDIKNNKGAIIICFSHTDLKTKQQTV